MKGFKQGRHSQRERGVLRRSIRSGVWNRFDGVGECWGRNQEVYGGSKKAMSVFSIIGSK